MIVVGIGVGILGAFAAGRLLQHRVDGMRPTDLSTFAIMIPMLLAAALLASFIPARRASQVDPMSALRQEERGFQAHCYFCRFRLPRRSPSISSALGVS